MKTRDSIFGPLRKSRQRPGNHAFRTMTRESHQGLFETLSTQGQIHTPLQNNAQACLFVRVPLRGRNSRGPSNIDARCACIDAAGLSPGLLVRACAGFLTLPSLLVCVRACVSCTRSSPPFLCEFLPARRRPRVARGATMHPSCDPRRGSYSELPRRQSGGSSGQT